MKVSSIKTYIVPESISTSDWCKGNAWVLVKVETDADIVGWGESYVLHDRERSIVQLIEELSRYVIGLDPFQIKRFTNLAYSKFSEYRGGAGYFSAVSGIEIAMWDIVGKALDTPVHKLLGGSCRDRIKVYANCWSHIPQTAEELANHAAGHVAAGFKAVKIYPFLYSDDVNEGIARLDAVYEAVNCKAEILVDAWCVANISNLSAISDALRRCKVKWFEDPVTPDDPELLAEIRYAAGVPIVTGETICTKKGFKPLLERRAADVLNPEITSCGILEIKEIAAMAEPYSVEVAIHNYNSNAVGLAAGLQVASMIPNFAMLEFFDRFVEPSKLFSKHAYVVEEDGCIALSNQSGLGVSIDEDVLKNFDYMPGPYRQWPANTLDYE